MTINMIDSTPVSSADPSPYPSPICTPRHSPRHSRGSSPHCSPRVSPVGSPKLQLRRANSYRHRNGKKSTGLLDEMIKRKKLLRTRSRSTPDINFHLKHERKKRLVETILDNFDSDVDNHKTSQEYRDKHVHAENGNNSEEQHSIKSNSVDSHKKSPTFRKKSLTALLDLRKIGRPRLRRTQSQRFDKKTDERTEKTKSFSDDTEEDYKGPLFQATTMFVPGYDFKTKQSTPLVRKQTAPFTPLLTRRGSKDDRLKEKIQSTPNLTRRGSKDKMKKFEIKLDDVQRSESLPHNLLLQCLTKEFTTSHDELSSMKKKRHSLSPKENRFHSPPKSTSLPTTPMENTGKVFPGHTPGGEVTEHLSVAERQASIVNKQKQFINLKKSLRNSLDVPDDATNRGKVKQLSGMFEDGTAYWRRRSGSGTGRTLEEARKHYSYCYEHDSTFRQRAKSYENGDEFRRQISLGESSRYSISSNGGESGYVSPTDTCNSEPYDRTEEQKTAKPKISIIPSSPLLDDSFSSSWSHGQWIKQKHHVYNRLPPDIARVISTDLCVTEL